jgi:putative transposase
MIREAEPNRTGRKIWVDRRDLVDAIFYLIKTGCQWRQIPLDFPPWKTVHDRYRIWQKSGLWDRIIQALVEKVRVQEGRNAAPSNGILDSQSVKTQASGTDRGFDGGKKVKGQTAY